MGYDPATGNMVSLVADADGLKANSRFTYNAFG